MEIRETSEMDWSKAIYRLYLLRDRAELCLYGFILIKEYNKLFDRFTSGERTPELYNEMWNAYKIHI